MKRIICLLSLIFILACNSTSKKDNKSETQTQSKKEEPQKLNHSSKVGDYDSLLSNFNCNITIPELAKVLEVPEADLSIPDYTVTTTYNHCLFNLKGFGKHSLNGGTQLLFGPSPSTKSQNRKEIAEYLKRKKSGLKIMGMDIELAETGDCYLAYQPVYGRLLILNKNQSKFFLINYGQQNINTNRTKKQHEKLRLKMRNLANYLLQKHRKR